MKRAFFVDTTRDPSCNFRLGRKNELLRLLSVFSDVKTAFPVKREYRIFWRPQLEPKQKRKKVNKIQIIDFRRLIIRIWKGNQSQLRLRID